MKDIRLGIDLLKSKRMVISDESIDGIKEFRNYRWKDKKGIIKDEPLDAFNHFCDALRYAVATTSPLDPGRFVSYTGRMRR
jgi:phage terminase large subunit